MDLKVLHLEKITDFTDYFLICSGTNERQVQAIADAVQEKLRERRVRPLHVEGYNRGQWVLIDYGDLVVHVFQEEPRRFYALERLWGDAPDVTGRDSARDRGATSPLSPSPVCCKISPPSPRACAGSTAPPPPKRRC